MICPKVCTIALVAFLLAAPIVANNDDAYDDAYDDDGWEAESACYYDDECDFRCMVAESPEDCLNVVQDARYPDQVINFPYFMSGEEGSTCQPTSANPPPVGRCCPSCEAEHLDNSDVHCNDFDVNPEDCAGMPGMNYFLDKILESRLGTHVGACSAVPTPAPTPAPGPATGSGDPHFKTWTGEKFDYHGECDLVLVNNPSFAGGLGLRVHIRTTRVKHFSFIEKVAVQIGDDALEFANDVDNFKIDGKVVGKKHRRQETLLGGFIVRRDPTALSIRLHQDRNHRENIAKIDLHARLNGFPGVVVDGGNTKIFEGSFGLLGDWNTGLKLARNGKTELADHDATGFALEWQVRDTEPMLFQEARFPQFPNRCTPPEKMPKRLGMSSFKKEAEKACAHWTHDKEDCIFDVIATRDVLVAEEGHIAHVN